MGYDASAAIKFAEQFWDRPCASDSFKDAALGLEDARDVWIGRVWDQRKLPASRFDLRFVFNADSDRDDLIAVPTSNGDKPVTLVEGKRLEDCAHFLSRCLIAGGLGIKTQWSVPTLLMALREGEEYKRTNAQTLGEKLSRQAAQAIIDAGLLKVGDMIAYFNGREFAHSAMYTGKNDGAGRVTCHTKSRFMGKTPKGVPDVWHLERDDFSYSLLHIADGTPPVSASKLSGWWRVEWKRGTEFFFAGADGRAVRTVKEPTDAKAPRSLGQKDSPGYWFDGTGDVKFCWRVDGQVVTLKLPQSGNPAQAVRDGPESAAATQLATFGKAPRR